MDASLSHGCSLSLMDVLSLSLPLPAGTSPARSRTPPRDNKLPHALPHPVLWTRRNGLCVGGQAPAAPAGARGGNPGSHAPGCRSDLGFPGAGAGAGGRGSPRRKARARPALPSLLWSVLRCPTPRPRPAVLASPGRARGPGLHRGPPPAPPGLRGQEPESPQRAPSPPGVPPGPPHPPNPAERSPRRAGCCSRVPVPRRSLRGPRSRPGRRPSAPPMEQPALPALPGGSRGRGRGRPHGSTLSAGPRPAGAPASRVRSGAAPSLRGRGCLAGDPLPAPRAAVPRGCSGGEPTRAASVSQRTRSPSPTR